MYKRNLSPQEMFKAWSRESKPIYSFEGKTKADFDAWKAEAKPKVLACLGEFPERVPLNPELICEWEHDGLVKQRWLIDVGKHISAMLILARPKDLKDGERRPAICAWHGHGPYGKEVVMGNDSSPEMRGQISQLNYNYGHQMAKLGYVTFGIDWIGAGERNDANKPHSKAQAGGRDWCNLLYLHATMLGTTSIAINVSHGMAATDFVCSQPYVDPERLGVMGLSGGGTMTTWTALCDERLKAAEIMCYTGLWQNFGIQDTNYCGMQVAPGLYKLVDLPDLQGLIAPLPLVVDIGVHDTCFMIEDAMASYKQIERIYAAAGASDRLELDLFTGEHAWGGNKSEAFFAKYL